MGIAPKQKGLRSVLAAFGAATGLFIACSGTSHEFDNPPTGGSGGTDAGTGGSGTGGLGASSGSSVGNSSGTAGQTGGGNGNGGTGDGGTGDGGVGASAGNDAIGGEGGAPPSGDCTPGDTTPCYESPTGASYGPIPEVVQGSCLLGVRTCTTELAWGACLGAVPPQATDSCEAGNDANCNGTANEGCPCTNGSTRECGSDVGSCVKGTQTCAGAAWGACVGETVAKAADTCESGNDDNCNGSPNNGCVCINGAKEACGIATGNCEQGERTCNNGVWGGCVGGVVAQPKDACAPVGDDANCNGVANEGCDCTPGATRACSNCGTQKCGNDGKWELTCTGAGVCAPGDVKTQDIACGNCGTQSQKATCTAQCGWGAWVNQGSCLGSGPCKPGVTADQSQVIACGNCGTQTQTRSCTAQCDWPATWTNAAGGCMGSGCSPGSTQPEAAISCSYCGEQNRQRVCSASCQMGSIVNNGACVQKECSTMPGDERTGYVSCIHPDLTNQVCLPSQKCCLSFAGGYSCKSGCTGQDITVACDGPEDCTGGLFCCQQFDPNGHETPYTDCRADCPSLIRCHADSDCPYANTHCSKFATQQSSYRNGICYPNGFNL